MNSLRLKDRIIKLTAFYPAGIILSGILSALIILNVLSFLPFWGVFLIALVFAIVLSFFSLRIGLNYFIWFIIGVGSFYLNSYLLNLKNVTLNGHGSVYAELYVSATDTNLPVLDSSYLQVPEYCFMKVYKIKLSFDKNVKLTSGTIYISNKDKYQFKYGRNYKMMGTLSLAETRYKGNFANYLKSRKVIYVFYPRNIVETKDQNFPGSLLINLIAFRDRLLSACTYSIKDVEVKNFLAGILFGCRQGFDQNIKKQFLETGTIHIIAISGTHIGILALLLLLLLRIVPIRMRYILLPALLFVYIVIIGYPHSALRAFIMIAFYMILKSLLKTQKAMNILCLTASIMLLINPFSILNSGFIFSFVIVTFLILGWNAVSSVIQCSNESYHWVPKRGLSFSLKMRKGIKSKIITAIITTIIAGFASVPLQLCYNNIFTPIMPIVNIIILPLLFPLFFFCILKILFYPLLLHVGFLCASLNFFISGIVHTIYNVVESGYNTNSSFYLTNPPILLIIVFYVSLISVLIFFRYKTSWIFAIGLIVSIALIITFQLFKSNEIILLTGAGDTPASVVIINHKESTATVLNCPAKSAYDISTILKKNGVNKLSSLYLEKLNSYYAGGVIQLFKTYYPVTIFVIEKTRNSSMSKEIEEMCYNNRINISEAPEIKAKTVNLHLIRMVDGITEYQIECDKLKNGKVCYIIYKNSKKIGNADFFFSNKLQQKILTD